MIFDPLWFVFAIPGILLGLWAQMRVKSAFRKWQQVETAGRHTGAEVAERILHLAGLHDVGIEETPGELTDHYDPKDRVVRLSSSVYRSTSVAAAGIAAHETGHALQHQQNYAFMSLRQGMVPLLRTTMPMTTWVIIGGFVLMSMGHVWGSKLLWLGVMCYAVLFLFQMVTLPVEFNASSRAKTLLKENGLLQGSEGEGVSEILNAAAWTYVAAAIATLMQLLYFIMRARD